MKKRTRKGGQGAEQGIINVVFQSSGFQQSSSDPFSLYIYSGDGAFVSGERWISDSYNQIASEEAGANGTQKYFSVAIEDLSLDYYNQPSSLGETSLVRCLAFL